MAEETTPMDPTTGTPKPNYALLDVRGETSPLLSAAGLEHLAHATLIRHLTE